MKKIWFLIIWILVILYLWVWILLTHFSVDVTIREQCWNENHECYRYCWTEKNKTTCLLFKQWYWKWIFLWWYSFIESKIKDIFKSEEYSEYWLLQWPNWVITLDDFENEWKIFNDDEFNEELQNWNICNDRKNACVPLVFKKDNTLVTPYEYNKFIETETGLQLSDTEYWTDLKTFSKISWLKEANSDYVNWKLWIFMFDPYTKFYTKK